MFADDNNRTIYLSMDEGITYTPHSVDVNQKTLLFHPIMKEWILGFDDVTHVRTLS